MKTALILLYALSLILISIATMVFGWGIEAKNWGWIAFGYLWSTLPLLGTAFQRTLTVERALKEGRY